MSDFTRAVFDPLKRFVRVLMQQGRVEIDADAPDPQAAANKPTRVASPGAQSATNHTEIRKPD